MNYYEMIVIIDPNLDDSAIEETVQRIKDVIIKQGGEIFKTDNWGRRKLAYELNKHEKGCYILLLFKSPPATISEIDKLNKVVDSIIKYMVVRLVKKKQIEAVTAAVPAKVESDKPADVEVKAEEKGEGTSQPEDKQNV